MARQPQAGTRDARPANRPGDPDLVVHGMTTEGHRLTMLDARISRLALGGRSMTLHASTLALNAHLDIGTLWTSAAYGTAHLHEWLGDTGLKIVEWDSNDRGQTTRFTHEWTPPPTYEVDL